MTAHQDQLSSGSGLAVVQKTVKSFWRSKGAIVARAVENNAFLLKAIAMGASAIVVSVIAWALVLLMSKTDTNSNRLTRIETMIEIIQNDVRRIADDD